MRIRPNPYDEPPKNHLVTFIVLLLIAAIVIYAVYRLTRPDIEPSSKMKITIHYFMSTWVKWNNISLFCFLVSSSNLFLCLFAFAISFVWNLYYVCIFLSPLLVVRLWWYMVLYSVIRRKEKFTRLGVRAIMIFFRRICGAV